MRPLVPALLAVLLAGRAVGGQVEVSVPQAEPVGGSGVVGAAPSAVAPVALSVPSLTAAPLAPTPVPTSLAAAVAVPGAAASPAATLAPAAASPAPLPASILVQGRVEAIAPALKGAPPAAHDGAADDGAELASASGAALFDAAAPRESGGLWTKVRGWLPFGDRAPAWPGRAGDKVRVEGRAFTLDAPLDAAGRWVSNRDYEVDLARLDPESLARSRAEIARLASLKGTDLPHLKLVAASADGAVVVREHPELWPAERVFAQGLMDHQRRGWAELAARLIRAGASVDLSPRNLAWQPWGGRWVPVDASGYAPARPADVLVQLLDGPARRAGIEPADFLAGVRGRLGPDSEAWARTLADLRGDERLAPSLDALAARDRSAPPAPHVVFGPAERPGLFPDRVGRPGEAAAVLGYDPLTAGPRTDLHADDPGKMNTTIRGVEPPGKARSVVKTARWDVVRRELALRRVVRRWFGRYFDAPAALGVERGAESYLVMEWKPGERAYVDAPLSPERRAALAVLANAFGVYDMNPGNVLFREGARPVLLDFEQALGRRGPVVNRLPDEGLAAELPWVSRARLNRAEDYQPAVRAWRALLSEPASKAALKEDFAAAGYSPAEADALVALVEANTADLDWTIQNDVDFVNEFARRRPSRPR